MQRSALALAMMLSCVIGMWGARLPADESAPAPAVKKPPGTTAEEGRRRWEQAFAHQLDMLRDQQARRRVPPQARNHEAILEAFRAGDGEAAERAIRGHLEGGRRRLLTPPGAGSPAGPAA